MSAAERARFVDTLIAIKSNLQRLQAETPANGAARRRAA
jgi:hypothetical protein